MENRIVRLTGVTLRGFKNVRYGHLDLTNPRVNTPASILGLYGQNGSGKTGLIDALGVLKYALGGQPVPRHVVDYIHVDETHADLTYHLEIRDGTSGAVYPVRYELQLQRTASSLHDNEWEHSDVEGVMLSKESLWHGVEQTENPKRMACVLDTDSPEDIAFLPRVRHERVVKREKEAAVNLLVEKQLARKTSRSFLFSKELRDMLQEQEEPLSLILETLAYYGSYELFVITTAHTGLVSIHALPLAFSYRETQGGAVGNILLKLNEPSLIPERAFRVVDKVVSRMNIVLQQLVPGLVIGIRNLGSQMLKDGSLGCRVQMVSRKDAKEIPLQCESDGIKKLISVLQLLIMMYNRPSFTVAIDELDSGVFEYLLGEMLRILAEHGKGQLIFTSHNLRPLETLDKGFIAFTTTNPENRYLRLTGVKANHNLRDFYYRDIVLGEQRETVYAPTNNSEIAFAFREAGEYDAP